MATLDQIYMLRFLQSWGIGGKPMENVFFFEHTAGVGVAADLAVDFTTVYVPAINNLQTNVVQNVGLSIINLGDLGDFTDTILTGTGAYEVDTLPPFAAVGYTLKVNTRAVRHGGKRFSGLPETIFTNGIAVISGYLTYMEDLRVILQQELVSSDNTWLPVVIKRVKTAVAGTTPTKYTYRLPETDGELVVGEVVVALTSPDATHQVSREL